MYLAIARVQQVSHVCFASGVIHDPGPVALPAATAGTPGLGPDATRQ